MPETLCSKCLTTCQVQANVDDSLKLLRSKNVHKMTTKRFRQRCDVFWIFFAVLFGCRPANHVKFRNNGIPVLSFGTKVQQYFLNLHLLDMYFRRILPWI